MKSNSGAIRGLAIGITGGIACGKSEVARAFSALGAETADADVLAHEAIRPGEPAYDRVVARFGREIVGPGGEVDRRRLGEVVFQRPAERAALEAIIHPEVIKALKQWVNEVVRGVANGYGALADTAIVKVELHIPRGLAVELEALGAALESQGGKIGPDELAELRSVVRSTMRKLKRT